MTLDEWTALKPGDVVIDAHMGDRERKVFSISRVSGTRGQGDKTRVCLTVSNLKSKGQKTHLFVSNESGMQRFRLKAAT